MSNYKKHPDGYWYKDNDLKIKNKPSWLALLVAITALVISL